MKAPSRVGTAGPAHLGSRVVHQATVRGACKLLSGHLACPSALSQILGKAFGGSQLASSPYPGPQCHPGAQNHGAVYAKGAERRESRGCFSSVAALLPKTPQALHVVSAPWCGSKGLSRGLLPVSPASSLPSPSDLCSGLREPKNSQTHAVPIAPNTQSLLDTWQTLSPPNPPVTVPWQGHGTSIWSNIILDVGTFQMRLTLKAADFK